MSERLAGTFEPSYRAIDAAAVTEANEVNVAMGGEAKDWRMFSESTKDHWRRHVGAAVRAAYAVDFAGEGEAPDNQILVVARRIDLLHLLNGTREQQDEAAERLREWLEK